MTVTATNIMVTSYYETDIADVVVAHGRELMLVPAAAIATLLAPRRSGRQVRLTAVGFALFTWAGFLIVTGFAAGSLNVLGVDIHIDPAQALSASITADANGKVSVPLPIPNDPNAANQRVYMQVLAQDAGAPQGWSASRGMWMGICQ